MRTPRWEIREGDVLDRLRELSDESVHCVMTSPPYWGLRDYGTDKWAGGDPECQHVHAPGAATGNKGAVTTVPMRGRVCSLCGAVREDRQLGCEERLDCLGWATGNPCGECYICRMVAVFREVRRVLRKDGTCWVNMGDAYCSGTNAPRKATTTEGQDVPASWGDRCQSPRIAADGWLKPKDLCGAPWRLALAMQADGWWLRADCVWGKPNAMPSSVTDRPTTSHEYVFLFSRSSRYYYDDVAVREPSPPSTTTPGRNSRANVDRDREHATRQKRKPEQVGGTNGQAVRHANPGTADRECGHNLRSVWWIATQPYRGAHFATFPEALVQIPILAGTSEYGCCAECGAPWERVVEKEPVGDWNARREERAEVGHNSNAGKKGEDFYRDWTPPQTTGWQPPCGCGAEAVPCTVLDPFAGSGTTLAVAIRLGRSAIGVELNPEYVKQAHKRIRRETPALRLA